MVWVAADDSHSHVVSWIAGILTPHVPVSGLLLVCLTILFIWLGPICILHCPSDVFTNRAFCIPKAFHGLPPIPWQPQPLISFPDELAPTTKHKCIPPGAGSQRLSQSSLIFLCPISDITSAHTHPPPLKADRSWACWPVLVLALSNGRS